MDSVVPEIGCRDMTDRETDCNAMNERENVDASPRQRECK